MSGIINLLNDLILSFFKFNINYTVCYIILNTFYFLQGHKIGLECENLLGPAATSQAAESEPPPPKQPRVHIALLKAATTAYAKLMKTAYILAVDGLALSTFTSLVRIQKANGVQLIQGTSSGDKAK